MLSCYPSLRSALPRAVPAARGHTLLECLVALAIAAVLLASALPSWRSLTARHWVDTRARALATDLRWTRSHAIGRHQGLRLTIVDRAEGDCYVIHTGAAGDCQCGAQAEPNCRAGAIALRQVRLDRGLDLQATGVARSIAFHPTRGHSTAGTITLNGPAGLAVRTIVTPYGRVRSCSAGADLPGYAAC